jgi:hypothetical protein
MIDWNVYEQKFKEIAENLNIPLEMNHEYSETRKISYKRQR